MWQKYTILTESSEVKSDHVHNLTECSLCESALYDEKKDKFTKDRKP